MSEAIQLPTEADISKLEELTRAATRKTWQMGTAGQQGVVSYDGDDIVLVCGMVRANDVEFIAEARNQMAGVTALVRQAMLLLELSLEFWNECDCGEETCEDDRKAHKLATALLRGWRGQ
jgi:hypothetical protein